jgi:D-serine deaminase-like pyridoxal phosphate-dependent protein
VDRELALAASDRFETPVAVVDERVMEANLAAMAALSTTAGLGLRPHAKTHKSPFVASRQLAHGARGLTVATLREAEVFADAGATDLLIAHPPVGEPKLRRLRALAGRDLRLAVAVDDARLAAVLPESVEVLWEVDSGLHRIGTAPGPDTLDGVLSLVATLGEGRFRGLITHGGHAYGGDRERAAREERGSLLDSAELLRAHGIEVRELSVGSTPTAGFAARGSGLTEIRPGTYVLGDANQVTLGSQRLRDCALGVVATVVSTPAGRAVLDAGSKALSADLRVPGLDGHGIVLGRPGCRLEQLSEEHGVLVGEDLPGLGERVVVVPAHACTTVNLHPELLFAGPAPHWEPVAARGWR